MTIQISQNQSPIFFQFSMKTIISFWGTNGPRVKDKKVTDFIVGAPPSLLKGARTF